MNRRGGEGIEDDFASGLSASEGEYSSRAALDAGGASNAFGILHRDSFVGEVHDVDALVADGGADVAGDAFAFVREDPELREARVDVHEGG